MEITPKIFVIALAIFCLILLPTWMYEKNLSEANIQLEADCEKKCVSKDMDYRFIPAEKKSGRKSVLFMNRFSPSKCECISDY